MALILNGTDGLSDVDGSASTPAIRGTDTNTGIFFPAADTIAFAEGGAEAMRLDSSGHAIIGYTASVGTAYQTNMQVKGGGTAATYAGYGLITSNNESAGLFGVYSNSENSLWIASDPDNLRSGSRTVFTVDGTEVASVVAGGNFAFNSGYGSSAVAYGCRAWVNFNGTGTVAIRASGNVSSITDNGTGDYTINFNTAMPDANYALNMNFSTTWGRTAQIDASSDTASPTTQSTTAVRFTTKTTGSGAGVDLASNYVAIFR